MSIFHLHDCPARPWKNGLGRTRELAVAPAQAGMDDFLWRASVAEVDSAAPFSAFPGIDRTIVLLEGAGFHMQLDDGRRHALTEAFAPFAFAGESAVAVTLAGGPTRDFNLMVRRGHAQGRLDVWRRADDGQIGADTVLLFCARGRIELDGALLQAGDGWRRAGQAPRTLRWFADSVVLAVRIAAVG